MHLLESAGRVTVLCKLSPAIFGDPAVLTELVELHLLHTTIVQVLLVSMHAASTWTMLTALRQSDSCCPVASVLVCVISQVLHYYDFCLH